MNSLATRFWRPLLAVLALATGATTLWGLAAGQRSEYYASIAVSMSKSWSNLLFGALDPAGTVTLDKIPGSYWVPALFVKTFGFSTWAVDAPNALATVATVVIVARAVKRHWGAAAGLLAGTVVTTTPIVIAVGRSNQPQSFFVLALAVALDRSLAALAEPRRRSLVMAGVWIGVAFQMYMLEAWAVWPALIVAWLMTQRSWRAKVVDLLVAGTTSVVVSLAWVVTVWLTPTDQRPYIGGTYRNSAWEMVFGYNGLGRFGATTSSTGSYRSFTPPFAGSASLGRIFSDSVAGQVAWLLPAAALAGVMLWLARRQRPTVAFLGLWLTTLFLMFSLVAGIHQFYTSALALPVAVLIALGVTQLNPRSQVPLALTGAATALWIGWKYGSYYSWTTLLQAFAALVVLAAVFIPDLQAPRRLVTVFTAAALLIAPALWSADARNHPSSINPLAGPAGYSNGPGGMGGGAGGPSGGMSGPGPMGGSASTDVIAYLKANRGDAKYLLATFGAQSAAQYITATGDSILPIGGFDGQDPVPTLEQFQAMVAAGDVRYVLGGQQGGRGGQQADSGITQWVTANCTVDTAAPTSVTLYTCE